MAEEQVVKVFRVSSPEQAVSLMGTQDKNLSLLEDGLKVTLNAFGNEIKITGSSEAASQAYAVLTNLLHLLGQGIAIGSEDVVSAIKMATRGTLDYFQDLYATELIKDRRGKPVRVKNFGQRQYVQAVQHNDVTFGIGPAGTGKTYLAVVMAVAALKSGSVEKIILTRPAVEAGESLGFLPGDLKEKVDPYLRPIYDALYDILGAEHTTRLMDRGVIEIAPLAYMRGRTLDNAFVILDEAQNTTPAQMKMFLTRLGFGSKMIVNGDATQIDLPRNANSGLVQAQRILQDIAHISFVSFSAADVVRHPVVASIIAAYDEQSRQA
ncbi:phosphate starvation-inducible protein PhoH [Loigolactobacillus coryniformis subsp. coryniformis]|uniref:PhoH-like protein n=1 Tax=Loigolactobacillus coryniformis subsp. coryniformis KCTC 3167 = DSM 20001 TaxID=913848 RepID=A0A0R1F0S6_9LACO|nr:PhoH family protein [Loigolactobacillus coryniformis]ATO55444.1 phosphate starvation-inducible protein PhoH [Loigolactobacillus coryniformis subsp. coryniformis KCTC 3167 = DSM 20001]KRK15054.1 phosphate starvation-inducible protein PhoH, ATPase [Loigolactobacillus coryniformis subsp. coryniformis KCTC 3167 = DSM 20001]OEH90233.1 phosphate starvation-inducible protein PhoH [Loigolactobacillus coryniformis subsp. coryniformis]